MRQMPAITIVVPNYNHARYLRQRIDSVLHQTFRDFELLLLDDCSADGSRDILRDYASKDTRTRCIFNDQNSGSPFKQWNRGVAAAKGEFVWIAESDDFAHPMFLERMVGVLRDHPSCGLAYCSSVRVDAEGVEKGIVEDELGRLNASLWKKDFVISGPEFCGRFMLAVNVIANASAVLFRRASFLQAGGADESYRLNGDWAFYAKMAQCGDVAFVARPLNYFRHHIGSVRSSTRAADNLVELVRVARFIVDTGHVPPRSLRVGRIELSRRMLQHLIAYRVPLVRWFRALDFARRVDPNPGLSVVRRLIEATGRAVGSGIKARRPSAPPSSL